MTGPKPPPKRCLHIVRSAASSFKWEYPLLSLRSSSSFLRLLHRLLATSISPFILPSITCFRKQFLRKMWPIFVYNMSIIYVWRIWHSEGRASWYILIIKANKMHYFSTLFGKELYIFRSDLLSIIRSLNTVLRAIGICHIVWQIPIAVNTILRLLMMDSNSARNM